MNAPASSGSMHARDLVGLNAVLNGERGSKSEDDVALLREAVVGGVYEAGEARHEQWKAQQKILCEQWGAELAAEEEALLKG